MTTAMIREVLVPEADPVVADALTGIVRRCVALPLEPDDPRVFCSVAEAADTHRYGNGMPRAARYGGGVGLTPAWAAGAAVGEVIERYAAAVYDPDLLVRTAFEDLDVAAVSPERFALYSERQYAHFAAGARPPAYPRPYRPFTASTPAAWTAGFSLETRRVVLVPAAFVFFPYRYGPGEPYLVDSMSTGLACGRSRDEAVLRALCEVVERDAVAIVWHHRLALPRIVLDRDDALGRLYRERFACRGARCVLVDATLDAGIPTVLAFFIDERGGTVVAAATRPDPFDAARKALLEAAQGRVAWKRELVVGPAERYAADFSDVMEYHDHSKLYSLREMRPHIDFLWSSPAEKAIADMPRVPGGGVSGALTECIRRLAQAGLEPIALDLTSDDVREAGYRVARVVIPGMQMLNARHDAPFLGGTRLRDVPHRLGLRGAPAAEDELNLFVHPFP